MPEMTLLCGKTFRVHRRAEKTCLKGLGMRVVRDTVILDGLICRGICVQNCPRENYLYRR